MAKKLLNRNNVVTMPFDFVSKLQNQRLVDSVESLRNKGSLPEVGSGLISASNTAVGSGPITPELYNSMYYPNLQQLVNQTVAAPDQLELGSGPIAPQTYEKMHPDVFKKRLNYGMYFQ